MYVMSDFSSGSGVSTSVSIRHELSDYPVYKTISLGSLMKNCITINAFKKKTQKDRHLKYPFTIRWLVCSVPVVLLHK
jgi:hypothetical protein